MNKPEWIPVNPCSNCRRIKPANCGSPGNFCERRHIWKWRTEAKKELLEYLIAICIKGDTSSQGNGEAVIGVRGLESMLKDLEAIK